MLSEVFWVAFVSTVSAMIIKLASMAYKSKCSDLEFCCLKIKRDVALEEKETEFTIRNKKEEETSV